MNPQKFENWYIWGTCFVGGLAFAAGVLAILFMK